MYSPGKEYFATMDFTTVNKNMWKQVFNLDDHHTSRKNVGVTYCGYSSNRKDPNQLSVVFKYDTEEQMTNHREIINSLIKENKEKWSALGDLDSIEFNHWSILCERTNDTRLDVINKTNDILWVAKHTVEDKDKWVAAMKQQQDNGTNFDVRWWALMENVNNPNEVSCVFRVPGDRISDFLLNFAETLPLMKKYGTVDLNNCHVKFGKIEWETMYNMPAYMKKQISPQSGNDEEVIRTIIHDMTTIDGDKIKGRWHMDDNYMMVRPTGNPLDMQSWDAMMGSEDVVLTDESLVAINKLEVNGDMAWACYTAHSKFSYKGIENDDIAVFTSIFAKRDGVWKLVHGQRSTGRSPEAEQPKF